MDLGNRYCNHENLYVIENKARRWKIRNANIKELEAGESEVNGQSSATQVNSRQPGLNEILPSTKLKNITYREISSFLFSVWFGVAFWIFFFFYSLTLFSCGNSMPYGAGHVAV